MFWFYKLAQIVICAIFFVMYDIKFEGTENIPAKGKKFVLISNHTSSVDPIILSWKIHGFVRYMGKAEMFSWQPLRTISFMLGGFPVDRGSGDTSALDKAVSLYNESYPVGIFPEGTRGETGKPLKPKSGVAVVVRKAEADVLPCAVVFGDKKKFRTKITVKYGRIINYQELGFESDSPRELKKAVRTMWDEVLKLTGNFEVKNENNNG